VASRRGWRSSGGRAGGITRAYGWPAPHVPPVGERCVWPRENRKDALRVEHPDRAMWIDQSSRQIHHSNSQIDHRSISLSTLTTGHTKPASSLVAPNCGSWDWTAITVPARRGGRTLLNGDVGKAGRDLHLASADPFWIETLGMDRRSSRRTTAVRFEGNHDGLTRRWPEKHSPRLAGTVAVGDATRLHAISRIERRKPDIWDACVGRTPRCNPWRGNDCVRLFAAMRASGEQRNEESDCTFHASWPT